MDPSKYFVPMVLFFCVLLSSLPSCSEAYSQIQVRLTGFDEMVKEIDTCQGKDLKGKKFTVSCNVTDQLDLVLEPLNAFSMLRVDQKNEWVVTIDNPDLLHSMRGGIHKMFDISYRLEKRGIRKSSIELSGTSDCEFPISFLQKGGIPINFDVILKENLYDMSFEYPIDILKLVRFGSETVVFKRQEGKNEDAHVVMVLTNKETKEVIRSSAMSIPRCMSFNRGLIDPITVAVGPGNCLMQLSKGGDFHYNKLDQLELETKLMYYNSSDIPIRCKINNTYLYMLDNQVKYSTTESQIVRLGKQAVQWVTFDYVFDDYPGTMDHVYSRTSEISVSYPIQQEPFDFTKLSHDEQDLLATYAQALFKLNRTDLKDLSSQALPTEKKSLLESITRCEWDD